jgi:selenide, water dikinase
LSRAQLALALSGLPQVDDERVLVGNNNADDAGVFRLTPDRALVQTVDILAPVVDDPYTFGKVAAINCLSDIYAMGGIPLSALNVAGFPRSMNPEILGEILRGGQDAITEAGAVVLGGHTFQSEEIRFGLAITGEIHPDEIYTNDHAQVGDKLVLTKPLGTGTIINCVISRGAAPEQVYLQMVESMVTSNRSAAEAMKRVRAHACTDVTGFGFAGHAWEMASGSSMGIKIYLHDLPIFDNVLELIREGIIDGSSNMNKNSFSKNIEIKPNVLSEYQTLIYSSETSGGLLIAVPEDQAEKIITDLHATGLEMAAVVGEITDDHPGIVEVCQ